MTTEKLNLTPDERVIRHQHRTVGVAMSPRKFTFMVTIEAPSEQAANDLIWRGIRNCTPITTSFQEKHGYRGPLYIANLLRALSKYRNTKHNGIGFFMRRVLERNT